MEIFEKSILVVAHPDDENLWFSSILSKVDKIILCFLPVVSEPVWTEGRRRSLSAYPLDNVSCLELVESEVFYGTSWDQPLTTEYGLKISNRKFSDKTYINNYHTLKARLQECLQGYRNVFTHNPWGEYGHVEHVQVYRSIKDLQKEMHFNLWYSNYVSNKSAKLMINELAGLDYDAVTLPTNKQLAEEIANIYKRNECWTWYDDYEWCDNETFIKDSDTVSKIKRYGKLLPINYINIEKQSVRKSTLGLYVSKVRGKINKLVVKARNSS
jgi:hypothetical protein